MQFNQRTARVMEKWAGLHCFKMAHHRVLAEVFREAWRERERQHTNTDHQLRLLRTARCRQWWDRIRQIPTRWKEVSERHSTPAAVTEWEDPLVLVYGTRWRDFRDSVADKAAWNRHQRELIDAVCSKWRLPRIKAAEVALDTGTAQQIPQSKRRTLTSLDGIPSCHDKDSCDPVHIGWAKQGGCFCFVVDCKPLAGVVNGHSPLIGTEDSDTIAAILCNLEAVVANGWAPNGVWSDPIKWVKREHNVAADYLCN